MGRLNKQRNKVLFQKTIYAVLVLLILLIGFAFFGFRALISGAMFFNASDQNPQQDLQAVSDSDFFGIIELYKLPVATNSASIEVSGQVQGYDTVTIYLNNQESSSASIKDGEFNTVVTNLKLGKNEIFAEGGYSGKIKESTKPLNIDYINTPPQLEIQSPSDNSTVSSVDINISGTTDPGALLRVNNQPFVVSNSGTFSSPFKLRTGENKLTFTSTDRAGNETKKELTVTVSSDF